MPKHANVFNVKIITLFLRISCYSLAGWREEMRPNGVRTVWIIHDSHFEGNMVGELRDISWEISDASCT